MQNFVKTIKQLISSENVYDKEWLKSFSRDIDPSGLKLSVSHDEGDRGDSWIVSSSISLEGIVSLDTVNSVRSGLS